MYAWKEIRSTVKLINDKKEIQSAGKQENINDRNA